MKTKDEFVFGQLMLRPTCPNDLDFVLTAEQHRDNSLFVRQWSVDQHLNAIADPNVGHFMIVNLIDCQPVGYTILVGLNDPDLSLQLLRLVITEKGRGFGRQATRMIKAFTFESLTFHRLWLDVMLYNKRAFKLYKSEDFKLEGVHREAVRHGHRFLSVRVMSVLRHEYFEHQHFRPTRLLTDLTCTEDAGMVRIG